MNISSGARAILVPILGLGLGMIVSGCEAAPTKKSSGSSARETPRAGAGTMSNQAYSAGHWRDGAQIYDKVCSACHSQGVGPELRGRKLPPEAVVAIVRSGLGPMPAFRETDFTNAELESLAKWLEKTPVPAAAAGHAP